MPEWQVSFRPNRYDMWHFQVEYGSRGEKVLHWFKLCIHDLTRTLFQLESVTYAGLKSSWHVQGTASKHQKKSPLLGSLIKLVVKWTGIILFYYVKCKYSKPVGWFPGHMTFSKSYRLQIPYWPVHIFPYWPSTWYNYCDIRVYYCLTETLFWCYHAIWCHNSAVWYHNSSTMPPHCRTGNDHSKILRRI